MTGPPLSTVPRLRVLIVDDEPAGRRLLRQLLEREPGIEITGICHHGEEAVTVLRACEVDLLFLDVRMPGKDGFEVLKSLDDPPAVVFVTAFDEFALRAFDVEAWDYLLKPFDEVRLRETLARARRRIANERRASAGAADADPPAGTPAAGGPSRRHDPAPLERLAIPQGRGRVTVRLEDVVAVQAESNYARFHLEGRHHLARISLAQLEKRLEPTRFVRVHRSWIINVDHLERQEPAGHGDLRLTMRGGLEVSLSRRYRERLETVLEPLS
ncbi:MAG: LytTR family DNA-binding domain-containing protein [Acidobacteriota bacterium]